MSLSPPEPGKPPGPASAPLSQVLRGTLTHALRLLSVAVLAGLLLGPTVGLFEAALAWCEAHLWSAWLLGLPIVGALAVGLLLRWQKDLAGTGTQTYIEAFEEERRLPLRLSIGKLVASLITLGSGGSGGKAGPVILVGASTGSALSRGLRADLGWGPDLGALVGAGAALGALFGTPLAGGLLAAEILYAESIRYRGLLAAIIASCVGAATRQMLSAPHIAVAVRAYSQGSTPLPHGFNWQLGLAQWLVAALVAAGVSLGFILLYEYAERKLREWVRWQVFRPAAGAGVCLTVGLLCLLLAPKAVNSTRGVFGTGETLLLLVTGGGGTLLVLALLLAGKALATVGTVASGGSGGLVFPALVLGALSGALVTAVGQAAGVPTAAELPLVGMAATLAAVLNVPLAAVVLLMELFGVGVTVPVIVGAGVGFVVGRPWVIYRYSQPPQES